MQEENLIEIKKFDVLVDAKTNIVYQELRGLTSKICYFVQRTPFGFGCYLWDTNEINEKIRKGEFKHYRGKPILERDFLIIYDDGKEKRIDVDLSKHH